MRICVYQKIHYFCNHCPVLSKDPYCLEVKVSVEDSDNENSQGECKTCCVASHDNHVTCSKCGCQVHSPGQLP